MRERERPRERTSETDERRPPEPAPEEEIRALQRAAGNQAVARWITNRSSAVIQRSPATWVDEPNVQSFATYDGSREFWQPVRALVAKYGTLANDDLRGRERALAELTDAMSAWRVNQSKSWWYSSTDKAKYAAVKRLEALVKSEQADIDRTEEARAVGDAADVLDRARKNAKARDDEDYTAALERLENELGIEHSQVEMVLIQSLLTLAKAPLTRNFSHGDLQSFLDTGGFLNYWQKTKPLSAPGETASEDEKDRYIYQQGRLEGERRLFGQSDDPHVKTQRAKEQALATTANVNEYRFGGAPTRTYGFSSAVLREGIKRRATYTPFDALDLMKKLAAGENFVGPEIVATHDNLAAIIRYASAATLREIIDRAQNPGVEADHPIQGYVEAQIHGPILLSDIEKITISIDEIKDDAYLKLINETGKQPSDNELQLIVERLRLAITQTLQPHGIDVEFGSF